MSNPSSYPNSSLLLLWIGKNCLSHSILCRKSGFQTGFRVLGKSHFRVLMPERVLNRAHVSLLPFVQVIGNSLAQVVKPETSDQSSSGIRVAAILLPEYRSEERRVGKEC